MADSITIRVDDATVHEGMVSLTNTTSEQVQMFLPVDIIVAWRETPNLSTILHLINGDRVIVRSTEDADGEPAADLGDQLWSAKSGRARSSAESRAYEQATGGRR